MNIQLDLPLGEWRDLKKHELAELRRLASRAAKRIFSRFLPFPMFFGRF